MTSLARQLARLKDAPSVAQGVERDYSSLLFDKKEAASIDRHQALKIGLAGLAQLKKLDPEIDTCEPQLFSEDSLHFNRSMISKEENSSITESIERFITRIAPYLNHYPCKQVLEWLIYRYQIHTYNGEFLAIAFLPFHDINTYGRLANILLLKSNDWQWLKECSKDGLAIPFQIILKQCLIAGGNVHLIGAVANFLSNLSKSCNEELIQRNYQYYYTFFTKLVVNLFDDPANATDQLISRIMPHLGIALKSKILPFKLSGMIILIQLSMSATILPENMQPIISLMLNKIKPKYLTPVLDTLVVICQRQKLEILPEKSVARMIINKEELELHTYLEKTMMKADMTDFLKALWNTIFSILSNGLYPDNEEDFYSILELTATPIYLTKNQASILFNMIIKKLSDHSMIKIPKVLQKNLRSCILRFADEFDVVQAKYIKKDKSSIDSLIEQCQIQPHEIGAIILDKERKRRRRTSSTKSVEQDDVNGINGLAKQQKRLERIENVIGKTKRKPYTGSPLQILNRFTDGLWEEAEHMLESFKNPKYMSTYNSNDFKSFAVSAITRISQGGIPIVSEIRTALSLIPMNAELANTMIYKPTAAEPSAKKSKPLESTIKAESSPFKDETEEMYEKRLKFGLEILNANDRYNADSKLFATLFNCIDKLLDNNDNSEMVNYNIGLIIALFLKHIKKPGSKDLISNTLRLDSIVKVVRFTYDHNILRNGLQILSILAPLIPTKVVSHIMSIFTFMGEDGLLRKDNELTLSIVEESLNALFTAILKSESSNNAIAQQKIRQRLIEVSRVFAVSLIDLPAHRRMRVLHAIANTMSLNDVWILIAAIYDNFCIKWQKSTSKKQDVDLVHDITMEFMGEFEPEDQLLTSINLIEYIIYLGSDNQTASDRLKMKNDKFDKLIIFDRNQRSIQKLRHYRFLIFSFIQKFLNYRPLYEQLGSLTDEEMYQKMVIVGKKLLVTVTNLNDFMDMQLLPYIKINDETSQEIKYWTALAAKTDNISDRIRCLLPANVSGHIICDLLIDSDLTNTEVTVDNRMREKAMQLLNIKLMAQGTESGLDNSEIHSDYLVKFAHKLNDWIIPAEQKDKILLCQNASFSLKLVAKRLIHGEGKKIFTQTLEKCMNILKIWNTLDEAMIGNILLLLGELIRSQNLKTTVIYSDTICKILVNILQECDKRSYDVLEQIETEKKLIKNENKTNNNNNSLNPAGRRRQRTQHSLCGKQYGEDVLLLCSLTCNQRLFEYAAKFVFSYYEQFLEIINNLSTKYLTDFNTQGSSQRLDNIRLRLNLIRGSIEKQEIRLLIEPFKNVATKFSKKPIALSWLVNNVGETLKISKTDNIIKVIEDLVELFMQLFKFRKSEKNSEKFEYYNTCEDNIITAFLAFIDHMKADNLKPVIHAFVDHLRLSLSDKESVKQTRLMAITVMNFANQFYDNYNTLAIPYFAQLFELSVDILKKCNASKQSEETLFINGKELGSIGQLQVDKLIILLLNFINKCAKNHTFFTEDFAEICYKTVLDEIENISVGGHEERCVPHLSNCLYAIAEASVDLFNREICEYLLQKTRHSSSKVRYRTLLVFSYIADRIGEELAPLIPMVVQYLSEALEDTNTKVSTLCENTIRQLRHKFGDDIIGAN